MKYNKDNWTGKLEPFFPHDAVDKGIIVSVVLMIFFAITFFYPGLFLPGGEQPANPALTPNHIKPEWYFLAAYQTLKIFPTRIFGDAAELLGMGVQMVAINFLLALPFIDRCEERSYKKRPYFLKLVIAGLFIFVGMTVWGKYS